MKTDLSGFDFFWLAYPRRVAKIAARKAYEKALKMTTADNITHAAKCYARERMGQDEKFTAHPASWLNAGHWGDYGPQPTTPSTAAGFYADFMSRELEVWDAYGRKTKGQGYPRDRRGGWHFPTRWPPGYNAAADFGGSIDDCYRAVRERVENGGPGWTPKEG